jgi:hypothetical protein
MNLKPLIGAAALLTASLSTHAVAPTALGVIDNIPIVVGNTVPVGLLFDTYTFTLALPGSLTGIAASLELPPVLGIQGFSAVLQDASFLTVASDTSPANGFSFTGLAAGSYALTFLGFATGALGGSYGGSIYASTASVPEPDRYVTLLAGLAAIGFVLGRRTKRD